VGIGGVAMWNAYRGGGWRSWLLPAAGLLTFLVQLRLLNHYPDWRGNLWPIMIALCVPAIVLLFVLRYRQQTDSDFAAFATAVALVGLLIAPTIWAGIPVWNRVAVPFPSGGPLHSIVIDDDPHPLSDLKARAFLIGNRTTQRYSVATRTGTDAADFIVDTGEPVMAVGGFFGTDPTMTLDEFVAKVDNGEVRYVLVNPRLELRDLPANAGKPVPEPVQAMRWASQHCTLVPWSNWRVAPPPPPDARNPSWRQLYDCQGHTG
jgi:hypothetical protein